MPIRAENRARYPADWQDIRAAILKRAGNVCEMEGCGAVNGKPHPITGAPVVLTVAHLDHTPENCAPWNLRAWCQRCHNRYDQPMRIASRRARLAKARESSFVAENMTLDIWDTGDDQDEIPPRGFTVRGIHPVANLLPEMSAAEFSELKASIKANGGNRVPIIVHINGLILDGRHRKRACDELGLKPLLRVVSGTDNECLKLVLDLNLTRRHLDEAQRAAIAAEVETMKQGRPGKDANLHVSREDAARMFNVSPRSVASAKVVLTSGIPEIRDALRQGRIPVSKAEMVAKMPAARQQQVAAELGNGKSPATIVLAASRRERLADIELQASNTPLSIAALGRAFPILLNDPPWAYETWSEGGQQKAAEMHYPTMSPEKIAELPIGDIAAKDAMMFMWFLPGMMQEAIDCMRAWGFKEQGFAIGLKRHITCGHYFRGQFEPLMYATRGKMPPPPELHSSVFEWGPAGPHSTKPESVRNWITETYPDAGKIELFCRGEPAPGWHAWGLEAKRKQ